LWALIQKGDEAMDLKSICRDRNKFRDGDVIAFSSATCWYKPSTWISARIQQTTHSPWNHVGWLFWSSCQEEWFVREARTKIMATPLREYLSDTALALGVFRHPKMLQEDSRVFQWRESLRQWTREQMGEPYSYWTIVKIRTLQLVLGYKNLAGIGAVTAMDADNNEWICSGYVVCGFAAAGIPINEGVYASPADVVGVLKQVWAKMANGMEVEYRG
jgi:hypothetical protein